jgi:hypothetical protein
MDAFKLKGDIEQIAKALHIKLTALFNEVIELSFIIFIDESLHHIHVPFLVWSVFCRS